MGRHPIETVFVDGADVNKTAVRDFERRVIYDFGAAAAVQGANLANTPTIAINAIIFRYDAADFTTADDGVNVIVDLSGRRFKKVALDSVSVIPANTFVGNPTGSFAAPTSMSPATALAMLGLNGLIAARHLIMN
ncbi:hypothetical protein [Aestuariivirga litoralis]|uniref:hypothetical protein n=1 Tax=Aestuariivirga litoralis TaxID=2650924 RepID=UPI0018C753E7|nr:hypothetical protein [Aestuariivirga litoralis]MBG1232966.1 hypothetical protein [Aestuariivirga litoralis]